MSQVELKQRPVLPIGGRNLLIPLAFLWGGAIIVALVMFLLEGGFTANLGGYYLLPWTLAAGAIILAPTGYLYYRGQFDFFNPLIYGTLSYIFPAFVGGGVILALGWSEPVFLVFVDNQEYNLPLSLAYVTLGFIGLTTGYFLPLGNKAANQIERLLPKNWIWQADDVWLPGILLIIGGFAVNIISFVRGLIGYQRADTIEVLDGLFFFLLTLLVEGTMLLWLGIFQTKRRDLVFWLILIGLLAVVPLRSLLLGSRSGLIIGIIPIAAAFVYSGRKLKRSHAVIFGSIVLSAIFIGIIYGTSFRNVKGSESRMNAGDYYGQIAATVDYLSKKPLADVLGDGAFSLAERIENLSALAVVVSNYEKLEPYEEAYGLKDNITNDALTSFVPRFLWPEKPPTSDARAYSDLYFNFGDNSFPITPFGDLLRNFGIIGIPVGMMLVGFYLRVIYDLLIATTYPALWKKVAYFPLLTIVSYESFYATLFPSIVRIIFVLIVSLWLANVVVKFARANKK